ncbi:MAG: ECF transporter S component [Candidatus Krumholzibacteriia bacterium]
MRETRKALLASLMVALTVSLGYALAGIPNVELMTLSVFTAGYLLGAGYGAVVGVTSITLHSVFNPLGTALPPLLAAQIAGFALIGVAGAWPGRVIARMDKRWPAFVLSGAVGLVLTLTYDVLTNVGAFYTVTGEYAPSNLFAFVGAGVAFTVMHLVWNTGLFFAALKPALNVFSRFRGELG